MALKAITELIVYVSDLLEAEGRVLRRSAARLGLGFALGIVAAILLIVGALGVLLGIWLAIRSVSNPAIASAATGGLCLVTAFGVLWYIGRLNR